MNDLKKIIKGTGIYLIGTIFAKLIQFLLLPIYTKYLSPSAYGTYDLNLAYATFMWTFIYLDIYSGILRFMFDYKEKDKYKAVNNGFFIFFLSSVIYGIAIVILSFTLKDVLGYPFLLFLVGMLTVLQQIVGYVARGFNKNRLFVLGGIIGTVATFVFTYLFLVVWGYDYSSIYWATIIGMLVNIIIVSIVLRLWKYISFRFFEIKIFKEMFLFSLPLSVNSVSYWFLTGFNRIAISMTLTVEANGLYAVVSKFGAIINLFTQAFQMAWQELSFSKAGNDKESLSVFYSKAVNKFMIFLLSGTTLVLPFLKFIFPYMIDQRYWVAINLMPLTLLSAVFSAYSSFMASIISTFKNTKTIFTTTLIGAIVNVVVLLGSIQIIGVQAAVISLTIGFFITFYRRVIMIDKQIKLNIEWKLFAVVLLLFTITSYVFIELNMLVNLVMLIINLGFMIYVFRNDIQKIVYKKSR